MRRTAFRQLGDVIEGRRSCYPSRFPLHRRQLFLGAHKGRPSETLALL